MPRVWTNHQNIPRRRQANLDCHVAALLTFVLFGYHSLTTILLALVATAPLSFAVNGLFGLISPHPFECNPTEDVAKRK